MLGAGPIAEFIYGKDTPETRRNVYRNPFGFGFFKHGNTLAALKSNTRAELAEAQRIAREKHQQERMKTRAVVKPRRRRAREQSP
jgi:hypothetical protein